MATRDRSPGNDRLRIRLQEAVAELGQRALEGDDLERLLSNAAVAVSEALEARYSVIVERLPDDPFRLRQGVGWSADVLAPELASAAKIADETVARV